MTKKAEQQIEEVKTVEPKLAYDQKLLNNIKQLEKDVQETSKSLQQIIGALDYARYAYNEYMKEIQPPVVETKE